MHAEAWDEAQVMEAEMLRLRSGSHVAESELADFGIVASPVDAAAWLMPPNRARRHLALEYAVRSQGRSGMEGEVAIPYKPTGKPNGRPRTKPWRMSLPTRSSEPSNSTARQPFTAPRLLPVSPHS